MKKVNISALVVGYNEGHLLSKCFSGLSFCDEIVYVDLGSSDESLDIAKSFNAQIIKHEKVPAVEWIQAKYANKLNNEWILFTDPDEYIDPKLQNDIVNVFPFLKSDVGAIKVPMQYYFGLKKLNGTNWGGIKQRILIANVNRFVFEKRVHSGRYIQEGFVFYDIEYDLNNILHHYWMQNRKQLFEKHRRYLSKEGKSRFDNNGSTSLVRLFYLPFFSFYNCYFENKGYKDGFVGLLLSFFWTWYQTRANIELFKYQKKIKKRHNES